VAFGYNESVAAFGGKRALTGPKTTKSLLSGPKGQQTIETLCASQQ